LQPGIEVTYELSGSNGSSHITKVKKVDPVAVNPGYGNGMAMARLTMIWYC